MRKIYDESPFYIEMSLTKMLRYWEVLANDTTDYRSNYAHTLLREAEAAGLAKSVLNPSKDYLNNELVGAVLSELFTKPFCNYILYRFRVFLIKGSFVGIVGRIFGNRCRYMAVRVFNSVLSITGHNAHT